MSCIKDWPVADRPREKLLSTGPATLSDTELLALILRTGHAGNGTTALDLSRHPPLSRYLFYQLPGSLCPFSRTTARS